MASLDTWRFAPRFGIVFVLRCTQKLLDRLNAKPDPEPSSPDTVLGDWYANLIRVGRIQVVLAVSERSLLPLVVPARDGRALVQRLSETVEPMLTAIGIPGNDATAERNAMQHWAVGKTANRRVLGSLNDLAFQLQVGLLHFPDRTLLEQSLWLSKTPLKVIDGAPDQATLAAFVAHRALQAFTGR
ncbi:hypothetical protein G8A07_15050 [Roseateles sp. DAIF2]|uniref:DUF6933 domain-containing protein n=1 Tax=Roseateles sp. DAIF2 TaxID=2714952 RepID=UPI0018A2B804|nr:hypothetical protein [Roseateles sp. DAIF2]QPF74098.1 hypothetical protein G8A07_15050 [Roseateles sp. DAIF2]